MIKGKTESGFEYEISEEIFDDYELLETLIEADEGDNTAVFKAINYILDEEHKKRLKEHLRRIHGKVPASAMAVEVMSMIENINAGKNC